MKTWKKPIKRKFNEILKKNRIKTTLLKWKPDHNEAVSYFEEAGKTYY